MTQRILIAIAALALAACTGRPPEDPTALPAGESPYVGAAVMTPADEPPRQWPTDPLTVEKAEIASDSLVLQVRFGGGCREHAFALVIGTAWRESYPVQVDALISHEANDDPCRALVGKRLAFSLAPLREAYRKSYGATTGSIVLQLRPAGGSVRYDF